MVVVICVCRRVEDIKLTTLTLDSLRVGFPTEPVVVIENGSTPEAVPVIEDKVAKIGGTLRRIARTLPHWEVLHGILAEASGRVVIVDPDVVFWGNCEGWDFGDNLIVGHRQNEAVVEGVRYLERLHTALMWIPSAEALREELSRRSAACFYPPSWTPSEIVIDGQRTVADVGAQIHAALRDRVGYFRREHLDCYDHVGFSTQRHLVGVLGEHYARVTRRAHELAVTDPSALRGLTRRQANPTVSWRYFSGVVDGTFVMRTEFRDLQGGETRVHTVRNGRFWCGADDEDDRAPLHIEPIEPIAWVDGGEVAHAGGGWSERRFAPKVRCKAAWGGKYYKDVTLWAEEEMGTGYHGWFWSAVTFGDGEQYWVYETTGGRWAAKADGTPVSWERADDGDVIDGRPPVRLDDAIVVECHDPILRTKYYEGSRNLPDGGVVIVERALPTLAHGFEPLWKRWSCGDKDAEAFMKAFYDASHIVDDIADGDLKGAGAVSDLLAVTMVGWNAMPFYVKHRKFLEPVLLLLLTLWACSDKIGASKCRSAQMYGYVFSSAAMFMTVACAFLVGGPMNARRALKEAMLFYRRDWESFPKWVKEREGA